MARNARGSKLAEVSICYMVVNLVPYHVARVRAAASGADLSISVLQLRGDDPFSALSCADGSHSLRVFTALAPGADVNSRAAVRHGVRSALQTIAPQIVCVSGWGLPGAVSAIEWCWETGTPVVMLSESSEHDFSRNAVKENLKSRMVRASSAALVGGSLHRHYLIRLGVAPERIFLGYDTVDNSHFAAGATQARRDPQAERQRRGLPMNYFLCVARFEEKKNHAMVLRAFARYRSLCAAPWSLVIAGDGILRPQIEEQIRSLQLEGAVFLPGALRYAETPAYFGLAGCFIHPSTTEQWGLVVNEAMAAGLPVLVSEACGCLPELVQPGRNGYAFSPFNPDHLASLMLRVSSEPGLPRQFGEASEQIIADWSPVRFRDGLLSAVRAARSMPKPRTSVLDHLLVKGAARIPIGAA